MTTEPNSEQIAELKAEIDRLNTEISSIKNKVSGIFLDNVEALLMISSIMRKHLPAHSIGSDSQVDNLLDILGRLLSKIGEFDDFKDV